MNPTPPPRPPRRRTVSRGVRVAERVSRVLITAGGIGTIVAVTGIMVFLVAVVVPLFLPGSLGEPTTAPVGAESVADPVHLAVDEYRSLGLVVRRDGTVSVRRLDTGEVLEERALAAGPRVTAWAIGGQGDEVAVGFEDGTVRVGRLGFSATFPADADLPAEVRGLAVGARATLGRGVLERTAEGQMRLQEAVVALGEPVALPGASAIVLLDHGNTGSGAVFCALNAAGRLSIYTTSSRKNLLTGKVTVTVDETALPYEARPGDGPPAHLLVSGVGDTAFLVWEDGRLVRFDARDRSAPVVAESVDLVEDPAARVTAVRWLLGKATILVGDSAGRVGGWFVVKREGASTPDGATLERVHELPGPSSPVRGIASSARGRMVAVGYGDGAVDVFHVTTASRVVEARLPNPRPVVAVTMAPKDDGIAAIVGTDLASWPLDPRHPEAGFGAFFRKVWYEGYPEPAHVWQSSSGTDDFEPKFGLYPLVFGTLKATFYSMLFGVPLALLAAIFTSEFLHPRLRTSVKSTVEVMAGLPSVVLGFLAALVIAPFVQHSVPATLTAFLTIPLSFLLGAYLWQLLPQRLLLRLQGWPQFLVVCLALPVGLAAARWLGPAVEREWFAGDMLEWLDGKRGDAAGGWRMLLLPLVAVAVVLLVGRFVNPLLRTASAGWDRLTCGLVDLGKFVGICVVTYGVVLALAGLLTAAGLDARGALVDTYIQRNALVVGFIMGFAIIPIIYTLAEDALSSVPIHLREASLGAGATPWQTAVRVVVPTAMSGLFSAIMIGLGRAVGETMIVLMAAGNTPILDWNVFSGFRTLSANIAVELPEAVKDSTHYRTLFLAALVLFTMTFALNTLAEVVRQRFRKRAFQL